MNELTKLAIGNPPEYNGLDIIDPEKTGVTYTPATLVQWVVGWIIWIAGAAAIIYLLYGGIMFITSGGDQDKVSKARNTMLYAVVGLVVVIISMVIFYAVRDVGTNVGTTTP